MSFSDLVCVFGSLKDTKDNIPIWGLWHAITSAATEMLVFLGEGHPLRGGLAVEKGWEIDGTLKLRDRLAHKKHQKPYPSELYGPVLASAHHLESKQAGYPRIVVCDRVCDYIRHGHEEFSGDRQSVFRMAADRCARLLARDTDGQFFIDYLGQEFRSLVSGTQSEPEVISAFRKAKDFVEREHERFIFEAESADDLSKQNQYTKLSERYKRLMAYFNARERNWI